MKIITIIITILIISLGVYLSRCDKTSAFRPRMEAWSGFRSARSGIFRKPRALARGASLVSNSSNDFDLEKKGVYQISIEKVDNNPAEIPNEREINYFETDKNINNWFTFVDGKKDRDNKILERIKQYISQGNYSMKLSLQSNKSIELVFVHFPEDWINFRYLNFDIYNSNTHEIQLKVKIGDYFDASAFYSASQKFKERFNLKQGLNNIKIKIGDIANKIKVESERKTIHLCLFTEDDLILYLDNMRLEQ